MNKFAKTDLLSEDQKNQFVEKLSELLDLQENGICNCSHDYTFTKQVLEQIEIPEDDVLSFFKKNGGYCDCEVMYNVVYGD